MERSDEGHVGSQTSLQFNVFPKSFAAILWWALYYYNLSGRIHCKLVGLSKVDLGLIRCLLYHLVILVSRTIRKETVQAPRKSATHSARRVPWNGNWKTRNWRENVECDQVSSHRRLDTTRGDRSISSIHEASIYMWAAMSDLRRFIDPNFKIPNLLPRLQVVPWP